MTNNKKQIHLTIFAIVVAVGLLFIITLFFRSDKGEEQVLVKGDIVSFIADRPDFIIRGHDLSEVKIYGIESSEDAAHTLLAVAQKIDTDDEIDVWKASIPVEPVILSQIYVEAKDTNGDNVDNFYFALSGNSDIFTALWLDNLAEVFSMNIGDETIINGLQLEITEIIRDDRCGKGVQCVRAGGVEISLDVTGETFTKEIILSTDINQSVSIDNRRITIQEVTPEAIQATEILDTEYEFILVVEQESKG
jgi:hypothetical protein